LQNLVDNAIKFTPTGGLVKVVVRPCDEELARRTELEVTESPQLCVSVVDSGPGISADLQRRLFHKFVTGGQEESGSGLGLAFCKLVVDAHGGHIWVESEPGQGTTFTFTLPVAGEG
jgi:signal transduction histidine kinase